MGDSHPLMKVLKMDNNKIKEIALDINALKHTLRMAGINNDGIKLGNTAQILRCKYGFTYKMTVKASGMEPAEYDSLVSLWDEEDICDRKRY